MRFLLFLLCLTIFSCQSPVETKTEVEVKTFDESLEKGNIAQVMMMQEKAWSSGDIDAFMEGYWNSPQLRFTGSKGVTYGWTQTRDNYKKSYPDKATMGKLSFEILDVDFLSDNDAILLGKYKLEREKDEPTGMFTLTWKKIEGKWLITSDMTCG